MAFEDRDYLRPPSASRSVGYLPMHSVTSILIGINVAVFLLDPILWHFRIVALIRSSDGQTLHAPLLHTLGSFTLTDFGARLQIWRLITFQFLHANFTHLLFNMFALYMFGPLVEGFLGRGKFLSFYLLCGVGGPIFYTILSILGQLTAGPSTPLVGASAGIFGVLVAAAVLAPDATVLVYGVLPMRLRTMAWLLLAIAAYTVIAYGQTGRNNAGGQAAHLGGAAVGWLLIQQARVERRMVE